ncbi:MAG: GNAT family N-acetyltransferase [Arenimonas sp.]
MPDIRIRNARVDDMSAILALNDAAVQYTSAMDALRLQELQALAGLNWVITVDDAVAGFLLAMREGAGYANANYDFFAARYPVFLYVDRIVIAPEHAGLKLGTQVYKAVFARARTQGVPTVTCEYNIEPPNEISRRFHDKFGFREIGTQWLDGGAKRVSLQAAPV